MAKIMITMVVALLAITAVNCTFYSDLQQAEAKVGVEQEPLKAEQALELAKKIFFKYSCLLCTIDTQNENYCDDSCKTGYDKIEKDDSYNIYQKVYNWALKAINSGRPGNYSPIQELKHPNDEDVKTIMDNMGVLIFNLACPFCNQADAKIESCLHTPPHDYIKDNNKENLPKYLQIWSQTGEDCIDSYVKQNMAEHCQQNPSDKYCKDIKKRGAMSAKAPDSKVAKLLKRLTI